MARRKKKPVQRPYAAFGSWLAELRKARGLTQQDVAEFLKRSQPHIGHIERGSWLPGADIRRQLAKIYQVPYRDMLRRIADYGIREQVMLLKTEGYEVPAARPAPSTETSWTAAPSCGTIYVRSGVQAVLDPQMDSPPAQFRLRVTGDTLAPLVRAGDELVLSCAGEARVGDRVVVHDAGAGASYCGEVISKRDKRLTLAPLAGVGEPVSLTLGRAGVWCAVWMGVDFSRRTAAKRGGKAGR